MTKKIAQLSIFCVCLMSPLFLSLSCAQGHAPGTLHDQGQVIVKNGMTVLGSWAMLNLVANPILERRADGVDKYFYRMNTYWNTVNLALAGLGCYQSKRYNSRPEPTLSAALAKQQKLEKILLFNAGLDVAYIVGGFYLKEKAINRNSERLNGYGRSFILQGGFLLCFDLLFYMAVHRNHTELLKLVSTIRLSPNGVGIVKNF